MSLNPRPQQRGKRVLFIASSAPRHKDDPTAPFILNMARDLGSLGWQVEILAPHAPHTLKKEVIDGVTIRRFQYVWPARWQTLCYGGGAAVNLRRNRLNALLVPLLVTAELFAGLRAVLLRRPALVHTHWVIPQGFVGCLLSLFRIPHVVSVHGADVYGFRGRLPMATKRWILQRCDWVVANSSSTKSEVEALCKPKALSVVPTGTAPFGDLATVDVRREDYADADSKIVLFVGRLIHAKGVRYLLEAMPAILARKPAVLLVVGDGPERPYLEKLAADLQLQASTRFLGPVPHSRVHEYFSISDVFVGPSVSIPGEWTEAQGNVFVEAMFARIPVVASRIGGIPDAVVHELTGLLVEERSPDQIAAAVLRIMSDPALAHLLVEQAFSHATEHFSRERSARELDRIYTSLLRRASGSRPSRDAPGLRPGTSHGTDLRE